MHRVHCKYDDYNCKDGKRSFVPFVIIVDGKIYGARVLDPISYVLHVHVTSQCEKIYGPKTRLSQISPVFC